MKKEIFYVKEVETDCDGRKSFYVSLHPSYEEAERQEKEWLEEYKGSGTRETQYDWEDGDDIKLSGDDDTDCHLIIDSEIVEIPEDPYVELVKSAFTIGVLMTTVADFEIGDSKQFAADLIQHNEALYGGNLKETHSEELLENAVNISLNAGFYSINGELKVDDMGKLAKRISALSKEFEEKHSEQGEGYDYLSAMDLFSAIAFL